MFKFRKLRDMVYDIDDTIFVQAKALYDIEKRLKAVEAVTIKPAKTTSKKGK